MLRKYYRVRLLNNEIPGDKRYWDICANSLESAWRKFCVQHFGPMQPNPSDYDINLGRIEP